MKTRVLEFGVAWIIFDWYKMLFFLSGDTTNYNNATDLLLNQVSYFLILIIWYLKFGNFLMEI